jgi:hypothetical protein
MRNGEGGKDSKEHRAEGISSRLKGGKIEDEKVRR